MRFASSVFMGVVPCIYGGCTCPGVTSQADGGAVDAGFADASPSSPDAGGADGGATSDPQAFCFAALQAICANAASCYGGSATDWCAVLGISDCADVPKAIAAGRLIFDPAEASACLADLQTPSCSSVLPGTCSAAFQGTVGANAPCYLPGECSTGLWCTVTPTTCPGVCKTFVAPGGACDSQNPCAVGSDCLGGICFGEGAAGSPCLTADAGFCVSSVACINHRCITEAGDGGNCGPGINDCQSGFLCRPFDAGTTAGACAPLPTSGPCTSLVDCATSYICAGPAGGMTCMRPVAEGKPCTPGYNECALFLYCDGTGGACTSWTFDGGCGLMPGGEGASCLGGWCRLNDGGATGACTSYLQPGAACTGDSQCGSTLITPTSVCVGSVCVPPCGEP